ncbi:hypothetical protein [Jonesia denitrificans]|uniref:Uncharacterized protein n=1 Tax=Jonesia denitrificans (strain ATCC 14870 / DSM 20603 / BCRC 15368 / CIP 55.134 / JCM 11481 / NBRC 15587 / NCTC 10816 / Prevot 55134) TaxID=471856 RepID=C7R151_JONDD|nr:hypothetical protein [Jonesia denitrificans]ACV09775.1 hypothetical protein Jden_2138 [Jonesia denitrificans DSM 20603]QXB43567.1 hypothetical protein I6L70_01280 [Jonesia denitrificans]SQH22383.1 Uncharacterised protein [Jonesia denitrificans]
MTRPFGHAFLTELAHLLDVHIDGTQDADDVERHIAQALYLHIQNGPNHHDRL